MLTFPLRYNFPPLSMRITSWIAKKKSAYAEKIVRKKVDFQAIFFVRLVRSLINIWFSTNQIEETNKQTKLRLWEVEHSLGKYGKQFRTVYYACMSLPTATTGTTTAAAAATTTNKSTATTVLLKWKSKLWRPRFRWDQFETTSFFSFVTSTLFFGNKSVQVKLINFIM